MFELLSVVIDFGAFIEGSSKFLVDEMVKFVWSNIVAKVVKLRLDFLS